MPRLLGRLLLRAVPSALGPISFVSMVTLSVPTPVPTIGREMQRQALSLLLNLLVDGPKSFARVDAAGAGAAADAAMQRWPADEALVHAATTLVSTLKQIQGFMNGTIWRVKQK
jgi:hypothetical protein